jgi:hypothetical protein
MLSSVPGAGELAIAHKSHEQADEEPLAPNTKDDVTMDLVDVAAIASAAGKLFQCCGAKNLS